MGSNDYAPGAVPYAQHRAVREARRRQGLADVDRLQRWLADVQRLERLLNEADQRRRRKLSGG